MATKEEIAQNESDPRYIHRPGSRFNPATTDILLPRRKETPYPEEQSTDTPRKKSGRSRVKAMSVATNEEQETTSDIPDNINAASVPSIKKHTKKKRKDKLNNKKKKTKISEHSNADSDKMFNSIEGTIKIDDVDRVNQLLNEDQLPTENVETNKPNSAKNIIKTTKTIKDSVNNKDEVSHVFRFTGDPKTPKSDSTENKLTENKISENEVIVNKVTEVTHEVVQDYLKDTDVAKVGVNAVFQAHVEKEKARMARKRKRMQGQLNRSENKKNTSRSSKPSDQEIGKFFIDKDERPETSGLQFRPGSKTSYASIASIASMNPRDSEHIFDRLDDTNILVSEDTMDEFGTEAKLVDLETEDESHMDETMDNRSVFSTASVNSSYGIKPYKQTLQRTKADNCSLRDIGFDVKNDRLDSSSRNSKTKQKLLYSRHERRPMSESVLRLAGKPPLPPSHTKVTRPHSDTTPRGMRAYSRYMAVDTDLF